VSALIADAGKQAGWRYFEFFTANIRNPTRAEPMRAYAAGSLLGARIAVLRSRSSGQNDVGA
jgi:site-specific recombinase XerC